MKRPLTGLAVMFALEIWLGSLVLWPWEVLSLIAAGVLVAFLFLCRTRFSLAPLMALVAVTGMLSYRHAKTTSSSDHITRLVDRRDQNVEFRGVIISAPESGGRGTNDAEVASRQFKFDLQALKKDGEWRRAEGRLMMFVSALQTNALRYGDRVECSAILRVPPPARNPGTFDWRNWLEQREIFFTATIRKSDCCQVTAQDRGNRLTACSLRVREWFEWALRLGLENEPEIAGVLAGMVIGERSEIPPDTYADFQRTGVFHVFAINGLHVGLVTGVLLIFLNAVRIPRRWCGLAAIPLLVLYVFATGAHPGAVRALVMACVWLVGGMLVRPVDSLNCLATAALLILMYDPSQLFDGGFILSFTVVVAIVTLSPRIERQLLKAIASDPFLPRQFVSAWRVMVDGALRWLVKLVSCSVAAWVGLFPLMAWYFHLITPVSIVANLLVIPLLSVVIALGLAATLAYPVCPWITETFNNANYLIVELMLGGVDWLGQLSFGHFFVRAPPVWAVCAYYALGIFLLTKIIPWGRRLIVAAVAVPATCALLLMGWRDEAVEVTVLDLTDGIAVFVNAPGERHDLLIDGGGDWSGARVVLPFLRAQGVDSLSQIVVTRGDKAHVAGLAAVERDVPVAEALHSGAGSRSKFFEEWIEQTRALKIPLRELHAGEALNCGDALLIRALHPPFPSTFNRSDDNSLVLTLEYGPTRVLLMSDAGETVERRLLEAGNDLRAQLIIKGRHGKESSCTDTFLNAVRPEVVIVAAAVRPMDRYPDPELRERLQQRGVRMLRTDETGAVTIRLTKRGHSVSTFLQ